MMAVWKVKDEAERRKMLDVLYFPFQSAASLLQSQAVIRVLTQSVHGLKSAYVRCVEGT